MDENKKDNDNLIDSDDNSANEDAQINNEETLEVAEELEADILQEPDDATEPASNEPAAEDIESQTNEAEDIPRIPADNKSKKFTFNKFSHNSKEKKDIKFIAWIHKYDWIIIAVLIICLIGSCAGNHTSELEAEVAKLNEKIDTLDSENTELLSDMANMDEENKQLNSELDELRNGKDKILSDLKLAYEKQDWETVVSLADNLHNQYFGTDQDKEGQDLKKTAETKIKEKQEAEKKKKEEEERKKAEEEAKGYETGITYDQLARNPEDYMMKKVKFSGKVVQVIRGDSEVDVRLAVDGNYDTVLYCSISKNKLSSNLLDDDWITVSGVSMGEYTYESTLGAQITIPWVLVEKVDR